VSAGVILTGATAWGQIPIPTAPAAQDGGTLFRNQCATCHALDPADPPRQGPPLKGVVGRKPGSVPGFHYTAGYGTANFVWDDGDLDKYLTNPQAMFPGSIMVYRQANPDVRRRIIAYLREQG
jgi:cytochrome c